MRNPFKRRPIFSLCHTTARVPTGWRAAAEDWLAKCDNPAEVEHVIVTDEPLFVQPVFPNTVIGTNRGRRCAVDGWNRTAELSSGRFLISLADDWLACDHWDTELLKVLPDLKGEWVVEVNTGGNPGLLTFSMLTRAYYKRYGYIFYPEYIGMYADNDFTDVARRDGVVIDARHLYFEHVHPLYGKGEMDDIHKWQHRPEAFAVGKEIYQRRRVLLGFDPPARPVAPAAAAVAITSDRGGTIAPAAYGSADVELGRQARQGIADLPHGPVAVDELPRRPRLAVCMPGDLFSGTWVAYWTQLLPYLFARYELLPIFSYSSNVYITRSSIAEQLAEVKPAPDLVLWFDEDNIVSPIHFQMLADDLAAREDLAAVVGWSWCGHEDYSAGAKVSCGRWGERSPEHIAHGHLMAGADHLREIEWSGFPLVLMRFEALALACARPFAPVVDDYFPWGFAGEDQSFFWRAGKAGAKFAVDRRVKVPHMKRRPAEPDELPAVRRKKQRKQTA